MLFDTGYITLKPMLQELFQATCKLIGLNIYEFRPNFSRNIL